MSRCTGDCNWEQGHLINKCLTCGEDDWMRPKSPQIRQMAEELRTEQAYPKYSRNQLSQDSIDSLEMSINMLKNSLKKGLYIAGDFGKTVANPFADKIYIDETIDIDHQEVKDKELPQHLNTSKPKHSI